MKPEEIKAFRKRKGLSQQELGDLCGVGKSSVSQWESGATEPTGGARKLLEDYISGTRCIVPLTSQEEKLLDENVERGEFASREDFLVASLTHLIKHGNFDIPTQMALPFHALPSSKVADDVTPYRTKKDQAGNG